MTTHPTDPELEAFATEEQFLLFCDVDEFTQIARAVLAKWGAPAQPAPTYKGSTPELHVGDSAFESWYSTYNPAHKSDKQRARDAYAAGMGDPLVMAAPVAQGDAEDAARYRWLAAHCRSTSEHWGGRWSIVVEGPAPKSHDSEDDFDEAVDAARKQGANHD